MVEAQQKAANQHHQTSTPNKAGEESGDEAGGNAAALKQKVGAGCIEGVISSYMQRGVILKLTICSVSSGTYV